VTYVFLLVWSMKVINNYDVLIHRGDSGWRVILVDLALRLKLKTTVP